MENKFVKLYSTDPNDNVYPDTATASSLQNSQPLFDDMISIFEVRKAVSDAKFNKACCIDCIPAEVLKIMVLFLYYIFF